jgi:hypothetical protein
MNKDAAEKITDMAIDMLAIAHSAMIPDIAKMLDREPTREFVAGMVAFSTSCEVESETHAKDIFDRLEPKVWEMMQEKENADAN